MTTKHDSVITLDEDNFEREVLQSDQPVLVDFGADWCAPCRAIEPVVKEIATEFEGIAKVAKVDVDAHPSLGERYSVASIPALLFFAGGKVVDSISGAAPKSVLNEKLSALLETTPTEKS